MAEVNFLEQIRATEKEAQAIVEQAHIDAGKKLEAARARIADQLEKSRVEAENIQLTEAAKADREAEAIIRAAAAEADREANDLFASVSGSLPEAVEKTAERIVGIGVNR